MKRRLQDAAARAGVIGLRLLVGALAVTVVAVTVVAEGNAEVRRWGGLAMEDSSYLRREAGRAVGWRSWGPEVFADSARTGRPVLLTIGSFTCGWTEWWDERVFGDPAVAAWVDAHCLPVKVDRWERPDLDRVYRRAVEASGRTARWPVVVWLSADGGLVQAGATPASIDSPAAEFLSEAGRVVDWWHRDLDGVRARARHDMVGLAERTGQNLGGVLTIDDRLLEMAHDRLVVEFDAGHGGFGVVPGFASPARLGFLARRVGRAGRGGPGGERAWRVVEASLEAMAGGGLHDHVGGGFFRNTLDPAWRHPNFEKAALDQALLAEAYLAGHRLSGRGEWAEVARRALEYALSNLRHPDGRFYTGEHAGSRSHPGERSMAGSFYLWTVDDVHRHAGEAASVLECTFGLRPQGNVPVGYSPWPPPAQANLLSHPRPASEVAAVLGLTVPMTQARLARGLSALKSARLQRPPPPCDRLIITQSTAAMVSSLAQAGGQWNDSRLLDHARRAAESLHASLWRASTTTLFRSQLDRTPTALAVADDFAAAVRANLDLHEMTGEIVWLRRAAEIQAAFDRLHGHPSGGYTDARIGSSDVPMPLRSIDDEAAISPNALAGLNLVRWAVIMDNPQREEDARRLLRAFAMPVAAGTGAVAGLMWVADALVHPPRRIILLGRADVPAARAARTRLAQSPPGRWHVVTIEDTAALGWLIEQGALPATAASWPLDTPGFVIGQERGEPPVPCSLVPRSLAELDRYW